MVAMVTNSETNCTPIPFSLGKCKTRVAYSAKPARAVKIDLAAIRKLVLVEKGEIIIDTPILLVIKLFGIETIVHGFGELIFKQSDDMDTMEKIAKLIYSRLLQKK